MTDAISFVVPGPPVPKGRARSTKSGRHYTPQKTVDAENAIGAWARQAMNRARQQPMDCPLSLSFLACIPIPSSWSAKKRKDALECGVLPLGRPDVDNFAKALADGMNGIVYKDDARIVHMGDCLKIYSDNPRLCVRVSPFLLSNSEWTQKNC